MGNNLNKLTYRSLLNLNRPEDRLQKMLLYKFEKPANKEFLKQDTIEVRKKTRESNDVLTNEEIEIAKIKKGKPMLESSRDSMNKPVCNTEPESKPLLEPIIAIEKIYKRILK